MSNKSVLVVADDDRLYKDPLYAGMVDNDLIEFFIHFEADSQRGEVVIERIPNYRPHRGMEATGLWNWYARAAATMLRQLNMSYGNLAKSVACVREFGGADLNTPRSVKAMSFHFELLGPIPSASIVHHDGMMDCPADRPEGSFMLIIPGEHSVDDEVDFFTTKAFTPELVEEVHMDAPPLPVGLAIGGHCGRCGLPFSNPDGQACEGHEDDDESSEPPRCWKCMMALADCVCEPRE